MKFMRSNISNPLSRAKRNSLSHKLQSNATSYYNYLTSLIGNKIAKYSPEPSYKNAYRIVQGAGYRATKQLWNFVRPYANILTSTISDYTKKFVPHFYTRASRSFHYLAGKFSFNRKKRYNTSTFSDNDAHRPTGHTLYAVRDRDTDPRFPAYHLPGHPHGPFYFSDEPFDKSKPPYSIKLRRKTMMESDAKKIPEDRKELEAAYEKATNPLHHRAVRHNSNLANSPYYVPDDMHTSNVDRNVAHMRASSNPSASSAASFSSDVALSMADTVSSHDPKKFSSMWSNGLIDKSGYSNAYNLTNSLMSNSSFVSYLDNSNSSYTSAMSAFSTLQNVYSKGTSEYNMAKKYQDTLTHNQHLHLGHKVTSLAVGLRVNSNFDKSVESARASKIASNLANAASSSSSSSKSVHQSQASASTSTQSSSSANYSSTYQAESNQAESNGHTQSYNTYAFVARNMAPSEKEGIISEIYSDPYLNNFDHQSLELSDFRLIMNNRKDPNFRRSVLDHIVSYNVPKRTDKKGLNNYVKTNRAKLQQLYPNNNSNDNMAVLRSLYAVSMNNKVKGSGNKALQNIVQTKSSRKILGQTYPNMFNHHNTTSKSNTNTVQHTNSDIKTNTTSHTKSAQHTNTTQHTNTNTTQHTNTNTTQHTNTNTTQQATPDDETDIMDSMADDALDSDPSDDSSQHTSSAPQSSSEIDETDIMNSMADDALDAVSDDSTQSSSSMTVDQSKSALYKDSQKLNSIANSLNDGNQSTGASKLHHSTNPQYDSNTGKFIVTKHHSSSQDKGLSDVNLNSDKYAPFGSVSYREHPQNFYIQHAYGSIKQGHRYVYVDFRKRHLNSDPTDAGKHLISSHNGVDNKVNHDEIFSLSSYNDLMHKTNNHMVSTNTFDNDIRSQRGVIANRSNGITLQATPHMTGYDHHLEISSSDAAPENTNLPKFNAKAEMNADYKTAVHNKKTDRTLNDLFNMADAKRSDKSQSQTRNYVRQNDPGISK